jgi:hypothetical protein
LILNQVVVGSTPTNLTMSDEPKMVTFSHEQMEEMARVMELRLRHGFSPTFAPFVPLMISDANGTWPYASTEDLLERLRAAEMALYWQETKLARALDALEWYGDEENYVANRSRYGSYISAPAEEDSGRRARNTMSKINGK